jgi:predicted component of type VI protein secretion system
MNKKILYALMCSSALLVMGCGGGSKSNKDTTNNSPNPAQPNLTTSTAQVTFANTVSAQTTAKITEIVSPVGTSLASSHQIATTQQETLVTALDERGEIRLAGITTATQPLQLNAESTAIALVRLAIQAPQDVPMRDVNQKIKTADEFAKLTRLIQTSLDKGELATDSEDVLVSILTVTQQVVTALKMPATATKSLVQARALPIEPAVESPFPFYLIDNATSSVTINQSGQLINNMPIAWSARSTTYLGKPIISVDSDANGNIAIPPANFFNRTGNAVKDMTIFGALLNYFLANNVTIPSDNGKSFELTLEQTEQTRKANIYDVYNRMILGVLDIASKNNDTKCGAAIGKTLLQGDKFKDFAVSENPDDGMAWLNDTSSANLLAYIQNSTTVANGCADTVELKSMIKIAKTNFSFQYKLFKAGLKVFNKVNPILTASEYASITEKSWFVYKYWNGDENGKKVVRTVCMGSSFFGSPVITNCANNFERKDNNEIVATFGAKIPLDDLAIIAKDRNDKETLIPNSIEYKTDTPDL